MSDHSMRNILEKNAINSAKGVKSNGQFNDENIQTHITHKSSNRSIIYQQSPGKKLKNLGSGISINGQ